MFKVLHASKRGNEVIEQVPAVMRSRRCFWVILNGKSLLAFYPYSLYRLIVEIHMGDLHLVIETFRVYGKTVVLGRDLTFCWRSGS